MGDKSWRHGAGILLATRDDEGRDFVLIGNKAEVRHHVADMARNLGYPLSGWGIPFGTLCDDDGGDYRRCAIREAAQEILNLGDHEPFDKCRSALDCAFLPPANGSMLDRLQPRKPGDGYNPSPIQGLEYQTFFIRVPAKVNDQNFGNHEFLRGTLRWHPYHQLEELLQGDWHWALKPILQNFHGLIIGGSAGTTPQDGRTRPPSLLPEK